jgi:beta-1,4-mannosyl-glycoprotein beta-1,4-N-acetylglucosaminyltransferase
LFYLENKERYSKFNDRIIHLTVPEEKFVDHTWSNEILTWNSISAGLLTADLNDLICIGSVDEIPNPHTLEGLRDTLNEHAHLFQGYYYYYMNTRFVEGGSTDWHGTLVIPYGQLLERGNIHDPAVNDRTCKRKIENGGWHFSYVGGVDQIYSKLQSYAHSEYNNISKTDIEKQLNSLQDPFGRDYVHLHHVEPIENLPIYVQQNLEKFSKFIYKPQ